VSGRNPCAEGRRAHLPEKIPPIELHALTPIATMRLSYNRVAYLTGNDRWETQLVLWTAPGPLFGWLAERAEGTRRSNALRLAVEELRSSRCRPTSLRDTFGYNPRCPRGLKREVRCKTGAVPPL
jgi:hypothetical protein